MRKSLSNLGSRVQRLVLSHVLVALAVGLGCDDDGTIVPPLQQTPPIETPAGVIDALSTAYQQSDLELFAGLLANDPEHAAEYLFVLSDPTPENMLSWGYEEEVRIHQRMFHPDSPLPGDPPVPFEIWWESVMISLTPATAFAERADLYTTEPDGYLDPEKWKATSATYTTYLLFELAGDTDYRVQGEANFVVIEDRTKDIGDEDKFLLLIWEDLGGSHPLLPLSSQESTWGNFKELYR